MKKSARTVIPSQPLEQWVQNRHTGQRGILYRQNGEEFVSLPMTETVTRFDQDPPGTWLPVELRAGLTSEAVIQITWEADRAFCSLTRAARRKTWLDARPNERAEWANRTEPGDPERKAFREHIEKWLQERTFTDDPGEPNGD